MRKIFVACDTSSIPKAKAVIRGTNLKIKNYKIGYKFGLEFFYSAGGRNFISKLKRIPVFLDLKINDIPNTATAALKSLRDLKNINYITVHINGGYEMIKCVKKEAKKINKNIKILGVSVLTSLSPRAFKAIGYKKTIKDTVKLHAKLARKAKLDGIICSAHEVKYLKKICKGMEIITPGIRLSGDKIQDQKRVTTPLMAFKNGANAIVIGRSITIGNPKLNMQQLINSLS